MTKPKDKLVRVDGTHILNWLERQEKARRGARAKKRAAKKR